MFTAEYLWTVFCDLEVENIMFPMQKNDCAMNAQCVDQQDTESIFRMSRPKNPVAVTLDAMTNCQNLEVLPNADFMQETDDLSAQITNSMKLNNVKLDLCPQDLLDNNYMEELDTRPSTSAGIYKDFPVMDVKDVMDVMDALDEEFDDTTGFQLVKSLSLVSVAMSDSRVSCLGSDDDESD